MSNDAAIKRELSRLPKEQRPATLLALTGRQPLREHINAYCLMCKQGSKIEVGECVDMLCPLRPVRPFQPQPATPTNHQGAQQ